MTIVCVDNTPIMLQSLKENARTAYPDADVQSFLTEAAALEYAEKYGCDVLLCEISPKIGMPFPSGKGEKINSKVNIIFVTVCSERTRKGSHGSEALWLFHQRNSKPTVSGRTAEFAVSGCLNQGPI